MNNLKNKTIHLFIILTMMILSSCTIFPTISFDISLNGNQVVKLDNGDVFSGELVNGVPNGYGTYIASNGWKYEGDYKNGSRHGEGVLTFSDGSVYSGLFKNNLPNGKGKYISDYLTIDDTFRNGEVEGFVIKVFRDGSLYNGEYSNKLPNGNGCYASSEGWYYVGTFKDGIKDGKGIINVPDNSSYSGDWNKDNIH